MDVQLQDRRLNLAQCRRKSQGQPGFEGSSRGAGEGPWPRERNVSKLEARANSSQACPGQGRRHQPAIES